MSMGRATNTTALAYQQRKFIQDTYDLMNNEVWEDFSDGVSKRLGTIVDTWSNYKSGARRPVYWENEIRETQLLFAVAKKKYPNESRIHLFQAMLAERLHDFRAAISIYATIEKQFIHYYVAYLQHATTLQNMGRYEESMSVLRKMRDVDMRAAADKPGLKTNEYQQAYWENLYAAAHDYLAMHLPVQQAPRVSQPTQTTTARLQQHMRANPAPKTPRPAYAPVAAVVPANRVLVQPIPGFKPAEMVTLAAAKKAAEAKEKKYLNPYAVLSEDGPANQQTMGRRI